MFKSFKVDNARRVEFTGSNIQIPKSKWAYLRNNIDTFHSTGGEGMPDTPIPIVNVSEWNKTSCGRNLFNPSVNLTNSSKSGDVYTINGNVLNHRVNKSDLIKYCGIRPNTQYYVTILCNRNTLTTDFGISNNNHIWQGGLWFSLFSAGVTGTRTHIMTTKDEPAFSTAAYGLEFAHAAVTGEADIQIMISKTPFTAYEPHIGTNYPYRLEDTDGVLHYGGDLPDGTADSFDGKELVPVVKRLEVTSGTVPFNWYYQQETGGGSRIVCYDANNQWADKIGTSSDNIRCNIAKASTFSAIGNTFFYRDSPRTILYLTVPALTDKTHIGARAWIDNQIALHGNIVFEYEYSTPQTPIQIKQYGETYGGVVWEYNEKPIQVEADTANVFSDKNVKMKFKAVSY